MNPKIDISKLSSVQIAQYVELLHAVLQTQDAYEQTLAALLVFRKEYAHEIR